jgi:hypothetical protein
MYSAGKEKWSRRGRQLNIYVKSQHGLWLPGSLGEYSEKLKPNVYPRTRANNLNYKYSPLENDYQGVCKKD